MCSALGAEPSRIEESIRKSRSDISSFHLTLDLDRNHKPLTLPQPKGESFIVSGPGLVENFECRMELWGEDNKLRCDTIYKDVKVGREVRDVIATDGVSVFEWTDRVSNEMKSTLSIRPSEEGKLAKEGLIDARLLGLLPVAVMNLTSYRLSGAICLEPRLKTRLEEFDRDDSTYTRVTVVKSQGHTLEYVCDVNDRVLSVTASAGMNSASIESTYNSDSEIGSVIPASCRFSHVYDGEVQSEEQVQIDVHTLNIDIPDEVFQLKGLGVRDGTVVQYLGKAARNGLGRSVVREGKIQDDTKTIRRGLNSRYSRKSLFVVGIGLLFLALVMLLIRIRLKSQ